MARSERSVLLYLIVAGFAEYCLSAVSDDRNFASSTVDRFSSHKDGKADSVLDSPGSVASSVSLTPLSPPLKSGSKSTFTFDELPPAAFTGTQSPHSSQNHDGISMKSPPRRRASFGGRLDSHSAGSARPPRSRQRFVSHPPDASETSESVLFDSIPNYVRVVSDFETAAIMHARRGLFDFVSTSNRPAEIAQWIARNTDSQFQVLYFDTVRNLTESLHSAAPFFDWRVLSLTSLHQSLLSSLPGNFALIQQMRVVLHRIARNKPLEYLTDTITHAASLRTENTIFHSITRSSLPLFVQFLVRAIDGQLVEHRFLEMCISVLKSIRRIWTHVHGDKSEIFYTQLVSEVLTQQLPFFELMAQWNPETDDQVDQFYNATENACISTFTQILQIEVVADTVKQMDLYFRQLFRKIPGEVPGTSGSVLRSQSFLVSLFRYMSPNQLDDYMSIVSDFIAGKNHCLVELVSLNYFLAFEVTTREAVKGIGQRIASLKTCTPTRLDDNILRNWLGYSAERRCQTIADYELVGLALSGTVLVRSKTLPKSVVDEWKSIIRQLVQAVNVPDITEQETFTLSVLIPARRFVESMINYQAPV